MKKSDKWFG